MVFRPMLVNVKFPFRFVKFQQEKASKQPDIKKHDWKNNISGYSIQRFIAHSVLKVNMKLWSFCHCSNSALIMALRGLWGCVPGLPCIRMTPAGAGSVYSITICFP